VFDPGLAIIRMSMLNTVYKLFEFYIKNCFKSWLTSYKAKLYICILSVYYIRSCGVPSFFCSVL